MDEQFAQEERLKLMQDVRLYPLGRVLRDTFDAENHETLGKDVARLMIDLSRVPYEPGQTVGPDVPPQRKDGWFGRVVGVLRGR